MIVREIKKDPVMILTCFDFFNDYDDTRKYLEAETKYEPDKEKVMKLIDILNKLKDGHDKWLFKRQQKWLKGE